MRSCDETLELISAALDGALTADEQAELDEHLSRCPACSALFDDLKNLREAAAELEDVPAPAGFAGRVMDAIAADPAQEQNSAPDNVVPFSAKKRFRTPWKGWAATAAVVAVVALGAVTLPGQFGGSSQSSTGATADCAVPSLTQADNNGSADEKSGGALMDAGRSVPESVYDVESPAADEPEEASDISLNINAASLPGFCGTLTLTGEALPAGLEDYPYAEDAEGGRTYEVPADFFFSCLNALEEEQPDGFAYEAGQEDGGYGLIIVGGDAR